MPIAFVQTRKAFDFVQSQVKFGVWNNFSYHIICPHLHREKSLMFLRIIWIKSKQSTCRESWSCSLPSFWEIYMEIAEYLQLITIMTIIMVSSKCMFVYLFFLENKKNWLNLFTFTLNIDFSWKTVVALKVKINVSQVIKAVQYRKLFSMQNVCSSLHICISLIGIQRRKRI